MGKLVIKHQGRLIDEVNLRLGDMKIGRLPSCDIVLHDGAVSGEHAVVRTVGLKSFIEDLGSTNGTFIENKQVKSHELRHGETIIIGGHSMLYRSDMNLDASAVPKSRQPAAASTNNQEQTTVMMAFAQLMAVQGPHKGKRVPLIKETVVIDNPGRNPARIYRTSEGYLLDASAGPGEPRLNDRPVPPGGQLLEKGDIIEIAGTKFQFFN